MSSDSSICEHTDAKRLLNIWLLRPKLRTTFRSFYVLVSWATDFEREPTQSLHRNDEQCLLKKSTSESLKRHKSKCLHSALLPITFMMFAHFKQFVVMPSGSFSTRRLGRLCICIGVFECWCQRSWRIRFVDFQEDLEDAAIGWIYNELYQQWSWLLWSN